MVLLNSISDKQRDLKNAMECGREELTTNIIINALKNRVLELKSESINNQNGDNLLIEGKMLVNLTSTQKLLMTLEGEIMKKSN